MTTAERLTAATLHLGEGPVALGDDRFACVDIRTGTVYEGDLTGRLEAIGRFDGTVGSIAPTSTGDLVVARQQSVELLSRPERRIDLPPQSSEIRLNDGKADPDGRFVVGTMAEPVATGAGALWSFADGAATPLVEHVTISNGLAWSADGQRLFYVDTPTHRIDEFTYRNDGSIGERSTHAALPESLGDPDGMTIDRDGGLWVAMWGGNAVIGVRDGQVVERIEVPAQFVTCAAFVGHDLRTLVITTAGEPDGTGAADGAIYVAELPTAGRWPHRVDEAATFGGESANTLP